jgi:hypothetical protein
MTPSERDLSRRLRELFQQDLGEVARQLPQQGSQVINQQTTRFRQVKAKPEPVKFLFKATAYRLGNLNTFLGGAFPKISLLASSSYFAVSNTGKRRDDYLLAGRAGNQYYEVLGGEELAPYGASTVSMGHFGWNFFSSSINRFTETRSVAVAPKPDTSCDLFRSTAGTTSGSWFYNIEYKDDEQAWHDIGDLAGSYSCTTSGYRNVVGLAESVSKSYSYIEEVTRNLPLTLTVAYNKQIQALSASESYYFKNTTEGSSSASTDGYKVTSFSANQTETEYGIASISFSIPVSPSLRVPYTESRSRNIVITYVSGLSSGTTDYPRDEDYSFSYPSSNLVGKDCCIYSTFSGSYVHNAVAHQTTSGSSQDETYSATVSFSPGVRSISTVNSIPAFFESVMDDQRFRYDGGDFRRYFHGGGSTIELRKIFYSYQGEQVNLGEVPEVPATISVPVNIQDFSQLISGATAEHNVTRRGDPGTASHTIDYVNIGNYSTSSTGFPGNLVGRKISLVLPKGKRVLRYEGEIVGITEQRTEGALPANYSTSGSLPGGGTFTDTYTYSGSYTQTTYVTRLSVRLDSRKSYLWDEYCDPADTEIFALYTTDAFSHPSSNLANLIKNEDPEKPYAATYYVAGYSVKLLSSQRKNYAAAWDIYPDGRVLRREEVFESDWIPFGLDSKVDQFQSVSFFPEG